MEQQLLREMAGLTFYHTIPLTPTLSTPGWPVVVPIVDMTLGLLRGMDLRGKRVLDVGCRDGLFAFEAEKRGFQILVGVGLLVVGLVVVHALGNWLAKRHPQPELAPAT